MTRPEKRLVNAKLLFAEVSYVDATDEVSLRPLET